MPGPRTRGLDLLVLQAHRAKGVRYPPAAQKECFKTWYSYALRRGEPSATTTPADLSRHGRERMEGRSAVPSLTSAAAAGARTYL